MQNTPTPSTGVIDLFKGKKKAPGDGPIWRNTGRTPQGTLKNVVGTVYLRPEGGTIVVKACPVDGDWYEVASSAGGTSIPVAFSAIAVKANLTAGSGVAYLVSEDPFREDEG